jgi:hypothetical protein
MPAALRRRHRVRLTWLMLFALLFQQLALAAHACEPGTADLAYGIAAADVATTSPDDCDHAPGTPDHDAGMLCVKHCAPDQATAHDLTASRVPALPPVEFGVARLSRAAGGTLDLGIPAALADPPPLRRFCSLLI